jgi:hypothetical protein
MVLDADHWPALSTLFFCCGFHFGADFFNILAEAGDGVAASDEHGDQCQGE